VTPHLGTPKDNICSRRDRWFIQAKDILLLIISVCGVAAVIGNAYTLPITNQEKLSNLKVELEAISIVSGKNKEVVTELRAQFLSIQRDLDEIKGILKRRVSLTKGELS